MGVSNRAAHAIVPGTGDLLMPERNRTPRAHRVRDVEDACFEAVSVPCDVFSTRTRAADTSSVFKSRITYPEADGPVPRDFAPKSMTQGERLDVFAARNSVASARAVISPGIMVAIVVSAVAAILAFWVAGGHVLLQPGSQPQTSRVSAPLAQITSPAAVVPDPVVTSSIPADKSQTSAAGFTAPLPRPARIERAGSILMIRPAGDRDIQR